MDDDGSKGKRFVPISIGFFDIIMIIIINNNISRKEVLYYLIISKDTNQKDPDMLSQS